MAVRHAPTLAIATGEFRVRPVSGPLAQFFSTVWVHRLANRDAIQVVTLPDATVDIQWIGGRLRVAGPDREPITETLAPGTTVIGFRFRPGMAAPWQGLPLHKLLNERVLLEDLWGGVADLAEHPAQDAQHIGQIVSVLERQLANLVRTPCPRFAGMDIAYDLVRQGPPEGHALIPWLTEIVGMSERTLRRRFLHAYGYGPKTLHRIQRFSSYLHLVQSSCEGAAALAAGAGYADQSHLIREARRLARATPGRLEEMLSPSRMPMVAVQ